MLVSMPTSVMRCAGRAKAYLLHQVVRHWQVSNALGASAKVDECCDACAIKLPKIRGGEMLEALKQPRRVAVANADFEADPRAQHGRKNAFWALVTQ